VDSPSFDAVKLLPSSLAAVFAFAVYAHAEAPADKKGTPSTQPSVSVAAAKEPKNVTPDEAEKLINSRKDLVILDVRTAEEFGAGHIKGAKNVSFLDDDFEQKLKEIEGKPVLVHCASGGRSARAVKQMLGKEFPELYHMNGGMKAWTDAGKEVVKPK
jgi:rhodanese-related sulfurtransferase